MAKITITDLLSTLGIEGVDIEAEDGKEKFREKFNKQFVGRQIASEDEDIKSVIVGKFTGKLNTLMKQEFGLENKELEGKKVEEILSLGVQKQKAKLAEIEASAGKGKDEAVIELQKQVDKYKGELTEYKNQNGLLSKTLEETKGGFEKEKKGWTVNQKKSDLFKEVTSDFSEEVLKDSLKLKGFNAEVDGSFAFELDDSGELSILGKDGKKIPSIEKTGTFMTPKEALLKIATEAKLLKMNQSTQKVVTTNTGTTTTKTVDKDFISHPNLAKFQR